jgi:3-deoxy-D-manno-octulosonate cytidylyltransferase
MKRKIAAVIPARFGSRRFPGKPLIEIAGIPMIERVYRQVEKSKRFSDIIVATDDERIANAIQRFGGHYQMTSGEIQSGTDRVYEILKKTGFEAAVYIQGDEPLISERLIARIYDTLATFQHEVVSAFYENHSFEDFHSQNIVKVVMDNQYHALYFSRSPVPYINHKYEFDEFHQHIGIYGYLKDSIEKFVNFPLSMPEKKEQLEQLRFLSNGIQIKMIKSEYRSVSVDIPGDVKKIEDILIQANEKN